MKYKVSSFFLLLVFFITVIRCDKQEHVVPYQYVNIYISLTDPEFNDLTVPGNSVSITGGVNGIIVYNLSGYDFYAYDRTCTNEPLEKCKVSVADDGLHMICEDCCESKFSILDGVPQEGPAPVALKQYRTTLTGTTLHIYN